MSSILAAGPQVLNLDNVRPDISTTASQLIKAGWNGIDPGFIPNVTDPNNITMQGFQITIPLRDFSEIQQVVKDRLAQQNAVPLQPLPRDPPRQKSCITSAVRSSTASSEENLYGNALGLLRKHVYSLANPFLIAHICKKLEDFLGNPIDSSDKEGMVSKFADPSSFSHETKECLKALISTLVDRAANNLSTLDGTLKAIKNELIEFTVKLKEYNQKLLKGYEGWAEFELLFSIPGFMALKDIEVRKIIGLIDQENPDQLREYVEVLHQTKALDVGKVKEFLKLNPKYGTYKEPLSTLLGQVIKKKPQKKDGIITYWNHPMEFFVNKTLYVNDPKGGSHSGTILKVEKKKRLLILHLHDKSEVHVSSDYRVEVSKCHMYKLWTAIRSATLLNEDVFSIEHSPDTDSTKSIQQGQYKLFQPKIVKAGFMGSLFKNDYFQFELVDPNTTEKKYRVQGEIIKREIYQIRLQSWDPLAKDYSITVADEGLSTFERAHIAVKKETQSLIEINEANADDLLVIKDEPNEDKLRLMRLEQIKKCLNEIRSEFLKEKNRVLLEKLLDELSGNKLDKLALHLVMMEDPDLANRIKELSKKYFEDLRIDRSSEDILKQIVLEANYILFVNKQDNVVIARTMELLKDAYVHINNIENNNLILMMGNTGSGKSTSISFLMGAPLEEFSNQVGEKVVRVAEGHEIYPKIGQSIGTSETIYTQGFKIPEIESMLGDCPGFNDTRGGDYELCTNLSIDQSIRKAKGIHSIVIVLPANAFLVDRGNIVMELLNTVQQRFPKTLDASQPGNNARVYLLVTKQNQAQSEVVKMLKNGMRFLELVKESQAQIDDLIQRGSESDSFGVTAIKRRQNVWRALHQMHINKQIDFIDTKDEEQRAELLEKYSKSVPTLDKGQYLPAMSGKDMQQKFGDTVQMSAHTWTHHIFGQYLQTLPSSIKIVEQEQARKRERIEELGKDKEQKLDLARNLAEEIEELEGFAKLLEDNEKNVQDPILRQELLAQATQHANDKLENEKGSLNAVRKKLKKKNQNLQDVEGEIKGLETDITKTQKKITELKAIIAPLKTGDKVTKLWTDKMNPNDNLYLTYWTSEEARSNAAKRVEIQAADSGGVAYNGTAGAYRGKTSPIAIIQRGYRLVPSNDEQRQVFSISGQGGGYIAKVDGLRYRIDIACTAMPDGKKVSYGYELDWIGAEPLPWIEITHTIPNHEYHYATIVNKESEIGLLENELITLNKQLTGGDTITGAQNRKQTIEAEIQDVELAIKDHLTKIQDLEDTHAREQAADLLIQTQKYLKQAKDDKAKLEDTQQIDDEIAKTEQGILTDQIRIDAFKKQLKYLAIIIYTQWESAKLLRQFADLVMGENTEEFTAMNQTQVSCKEFKELFDDNKATLLTQIKFEYDF